MQRVLLAFRAFFRVLFNAAAADAVRRALEGPPAPAEREAVPAPRAEPQPPPAPKRPVRSEALTLLAALQREARFVDFVQESLDAAGDAQIGAVAREVHRGCRDVVSRMFAPRPVVAADEGSPIEVPAGFDAGRFRLTGNVTGEPPFQGTLAHHGWEATACHLPEWTGTSDAARIVAPAEVELQ